MRHALSIVQSSTLWIVTAAGGALWGLSAPAQSPPVGEPGNLTKISPISDRSTNSGAPRPSLVLAPQTPIEGVVPNPFFAPGCVFFEDYSTFGPADPGANPPPPLWTMQNGNHGVTFDFNGHTDIEGAADDALFSSFGGAPPTGLAPNGATIGRYIAVGRRTFNDPRNTAFALGMNAHFARPLEPNVGEPAQLSQLFYMPTDDGQPRTSLWWSPLSFVDGFVADRMFFGGELSSNSSLASFVNSQGVLDRFITLGILPGTSTIGQFFAPAIHPNFPFPTDQWFTIALNMSVDSAGIIGQSVWVKTQDTVNANPPFLDPRMAAGDIPAPDGDAAGWVNTYPGFADDPATPNVVEGIGLARTQFDETAQTTGPFQQAPLLAARRLDGVQYGIGLDPAAADDPTFQPNDYFFGPICLRGAEVPGTTLVPDFTTPYADDIEDYLPGVPLSIQTSRWLGDARITNNANFSHSGAQAIGNQIINNDNLFRRDFFTGLPSTALASTNAPLVVSSFLKFAGNYSSGSHPAASRGLVLRDSRGVDDMAALVMLGGTDPTLPFGADGMIYVRQPNPDFDPSAPADDNQTQINWINPTLWQTPPNPPLNIRYVLVPTGVAIPTNQFFQLRLEIQPTSDNPDELPAMRVFLNDTFELFPNGDPAQTWTAQSRTAETLEFWSGHEQLGQFEIVQVDDVFFDGPLRPVAAGPPFVAPFADGFESDAFADTIDGQGATPFLDPASIPTGHPTQNEPQLTITSSASAPATGDAVCRYQLLDVFLDDQSLLPTPGSVIAISTAPLPPLAPGSPSFACPGVVPGASFILPPPFEIRTPNSGVRIGLGTWDLLSSTPTPFDPTLGDATGFDYVFSLAPRYRAAIPTKQALVVRGPADATNHVLRLKNVGGIDTSLTPEEIFFDSFDASLPTVQSSAENFPAPAQKATLCFDLYIESVDSSGAPIVAAPRSRLSLPVNGATPDSGRITEIVFGGPNAPSSSGFIPAENISFRSTADPIVFVDTGVSLLTGGGGVTGPLVNRWFRLCAQINDAGAWTLSLDEDRDGPAAAVIIASGNAIDAGGSLNVASLDSMSLRQGRDLGGGPGEFPQPLLPPSRWFVDNIALTQEAGPAPCADLAGDPTVVDGVDLAFLLVNWGTANPFADYNNDGIVNGADLATLLTNWGLCP